MFQLFDTDEDGSISVKELRTVLGSFGHDSTEEYVQSIVDAYDKDGRPGNNLEWIRRHSLGVR